MHARVNPNHVRKSCNEHRQSGLRSGAFAYLSLFFKPKTPQAGFLDFHAN
jgi:hypothetical protein